MRKKLHPVVSLARKKVQGHSRCDLYFLSGRVEIHKIPNGIFVRIARRRKHKEDFIPDHFEPREEFVFNGKDDDIILNLDHLQALINSATETKTY